MSEPLADFHEETIEWLSTTNLIERRRLGQYMTPRLLRDFLLRQLTMLPGDRVLDPAVGTGEFLRQAQDMFPGIQMTGWDIDEKVLRFARQAVPSAELLARSALDYREGEQFDFVIGNPPYFETKLFDEQKKRFKDVVSGRPNIFALFFQIGLEALKPGGTLSFVVPPSMNAGSYFRNLRRYLTENNHIVGLKIFDDPSLFKDAQTSVQVITVRKGNGVSTNTFKTPASSMKPGSLILSENPLELRLMYENSVSLNELGYEAITGTTVWNQQKDQLTNIEDETTIPLLYARNITPTGIECSPDERRPQYIRNGKSVVGPAIVVNRIIGGVGKGLIKAAAIEQGFRFAAENHLNIIREAPGRKQLVDFAKLFELITSESTLVKARKLTGNTQLSATEWTHLIPFHLES